MGEPLKIKRIEDMSRLSWLEHVITEASLMTRSIRLHSILMNWMCFPLQVWGGFAPPSPKFFEKNEKNDFPVPYSQYLTFQPDGIGVHEPAL